MPRSRPPERLARLMDAASEVFIANGHRRTQMADVARAADVSQGTLYNYVESKEALFYQIIDRGFVVGEPPSAAELPLRTPPPGQTISKLGIRINTALKWPELERARALIGRRSALRTGGDHSPVLRGDRLRATWIGFDREVGGRLARVGATPVRRAPPFDNRAVYALSRKPDRQRRSSTAAPSTHRRAADPRNRGVVFAPSPDFAGLRNDGRSGGARNHGRFSGQRAACPQVATQIPDPAGKKERPTRVGCAQPGPCGDSGSTWGQMRRHSMACCLPLWVSRRTT